VDDAERLAWKTAGESIDDTTITGNTVSSGDNNVDGTFSK
jgi:hypothetical protein